MIFNKNKPLKIGDFIYKPYQNPYFIAEISANHGKSLDKTFKLIDAAFEAGANAVKLQTFKPDTITFESHQNHYVIENNAWAGKTLYELYDEAYLPWEFHQPIFDYCSKLGLDCFSTPFDFTAVDFLAQFDPPAFKIASSELVDIPLIKKVATFGKPIFISTGMGNSEEIMEAVTAARLESKDIEIVLLKCTAEYPSQVSDANIGAMREEFPKFDCHAGLSDHTFGSTAPIVAALNGAVVIEKHITLSRNSGGVDSHFSMEPKEFSDMTQGVKSALLANRNLGLETFTNGELNSKKYRKSLIFTADLVKGSIINQENLKILRPAIGLAPKYYEQVLGKKVNKSVKPGDPLLWDMLSDD